MNTNTRHVGNVHYLYDINLIDDVLVEALFNHEDEISSGEKNTTKTAPGRGDAVFFKYNKLCLVFKHYQRGGLVAKLLHDQYFGLKLENTRAFHEWTLLHQLQLMGLPSPVPVAARVIKTGLLYQADLVMKEIEDSTTLADLCLKSDVAEDIWRNVGLCIKRFHDNDVYHADLNARNILVGKNGEVSLIDFDKGGFRVMGDSWKSSNLSRLNRSLLKFKASNSVFYFSTNNWKQLLSGYN